MQRGHFYYLRNMNFFNENRFVFDFAILLRPKYAFSKSLEQKKSKRNSPKFYEKNDFFRIFWSKLFDFFLYVKCMKNIITFNLTSIFFLQWKRKKGIPEYFGSHWFHTFSQAQQNSQRSRSKMRYL